MRILQGSSRAAVRLAEDVFPEKRQTCGFELASGYSTRIKDAGIAIRHSRGRVFFYIAGSRNESEGVALGEYARKIKDNQTILSQNQQSLLILLHNRQF